MTEQRHPSRSGGHQAVGYGGHGWMMAACCLPIIVIALVATGVASAGFLLAAVMCAGMMAVMMRGMDHGGSAQADDVDRATRLRRGR